MPAGALDKHVQRIQQRLLAARGARPQVARVAMLHAYKQSDNMRW
jgi:hypothetical protein